MKTHIVTVIFLLMSVLLISQNASIERYNYDAAGRLIEVIYNDSIQINYEYDLSGNMTRRSVQLAIPTGLDPLEEEPLWTLYPNPATNQVHIRSGKSKKPKQIEVVDVTGRIVYKDNLLSGAASNIAINHFLPGIYVVKLKNQEQVETHKLTKL